MTQIITDFRHRHHYSSWRLLNTLKPRQNARHFPDDIFKWIFLNVNGWNLIKLSFRCVCCGIINQYHSIGADDGLAPTRQPMMVNLLTHVRVNSTVIPDLYSKLYYQCHYFFTRTIQMHCSRVLISYWWGQIYHDIMSYAEMTSRSSNNTINIWWVPSIILLFANAVWVGIKYLICNKVH